MDRLDAKLKIVRAITGKATGGATDAAAIDAAPLATVTTIGAGIAAAAGVAAGVPAAEIASGGGANSLRHGAVAAAAAAVVEARHTCSAAHVATAVIAKAIAIANLHHRSAIDAVMHKAIVLETAVDGPMLRRSPV